MQAPQSRRQLRSAPSTQPVNCAQTVGLPCPPVTRTVRPDIRAKSVSVTEKSAAYPYAAQPSKLRALARKRLSTVPITSAIAIPIRARRRLVGRRARRVTSANQVQDRDHDNRDQNVREQTPACDLQLAQSEVERHLLGVAVYRGGRHVEQGHGDRHQDSARIFQQGDVFVLVVSPPASDWYRSQAAVIISGSSAIRLQR